MSKKDEARAALFQRLFDWESEKPGLAAFAAFEKVEAALDAYGAACAEEAAAVYAKQAQLATDTVAIIDGEPTRGKLKKELSAAEQRGYERGIAVVTAALEAFWDGDPCKECGRGDPARWPVGEQLIADLRSRPQPKREETE